MVFNLIYHVHHKKNSPRGYSNTDAATDIKEKGHVNHPKRIFDHTKHPTRQFGYVCTDSHSIY